MATYVLTKDAPEAFLQAFNQLAATKGSAIDDIKHESYFTTLGLLPIDSVRAAAEILQREAGPFLPDAGTWYRHADDLAAAQLDTDAKDAVLLLRGAVVPESSEVGRTRAARDAFVAQYEHYTERTLPETHPWKQPDIRLPAYGCLTCHDTGWTEKATTQTDYEQDVKRASRCACFHTNPVLEERRARSVARTARTRRP
jgi:hypothetical protein